MTKYLKISIENNEIDYQLAGKLFGTLRWSVDKEGNAKLITPTGHVVTIEN